MPGRTIGSARFLIGGDMNTGPHVLSQMLQVLREDGVLQTKEQVVERGLVAKHGDVCFFGGFEAKTLQTIAKNHDAQHIPYGIEWITPPASACAA